MRRRSLQRDIATRAAAIAASRRSARELGSAPWLRGIGINVRGARWRRPEHGALVVAREDDASSRERSRYRIVAARARTAPRSRRRISALRRAAPPQPGVTRQPATARSFAQFKCLVPTNDVDAAEETRISLSEQGAHQPRQGASGSGRSPIERGQWRRVCEGWGLLLPNGG